MLHNQPEENKTADDYANFAAGYYYDGNDMRAIEQCTLAISLDETCTLAYYIRGVARKRQHLEGGFSDLSIAINLDPHYAQAHIARASLHGGRGSELFDYAKALEIDPSSQAAKHGISKIIRFLPEDQTLSDAIQHAPRDHQIYLLQQCLYEDTHLGEYIGDSRQSREREKILLQLKKLMVQTSVTNENGKSQFYQSGQRPTSHSSNNIRFFSDAKIVMKNVEYDQHNETFESKVGFYNNDSL